MAARGALSVIGSIVPDMLVRKTLKQYEDAATEWLHT